MNVLEVCVPELVINKFSLGKRSEIPKCFPTLNKTGKQPVLNTGTESGPGIGCSRMLGTGNFPDFFGKNPVPGIWHSGTQTSRMYHVFHNLRIDII